MDYDQLWNVWWINGGHFGMRMVNKVWNISISVYLINAMNKQVVTIVGFSYTQSWTKLCGQPHYMPLQLQNIKKMSIGNRGKPKRGYLVEFMNTRYEGVRMTFVND